MTTIPAITHRTCKLNVRNVTIAFHITTKTLQTVLAIRFPLIKSYKTVNKKPSSAGARLIVHGDLETFSCLFTTHQFQFDALIAENIIGVRNDCAVRKAFVGVFSYPSNNLTTVSIASV